MNQRQGPRPPRQRRFKAPLPFIDPGSDSRGWSRCEGRETFPAPGAAHQLPGSGHAVPAQRQPPGRRRRELSSVIALCLSPHRFEGICVPQG